MQSGCIALSASFVRGARAALAQAAAARVGLDQVREGSARVAGRLRGDGHVEAIAGGPAIYTLTTVTVTTRRVSPGKVTVHSYELPSEQQPDARVVPLSLHDDAGHSLALVDLTKLDVLDDAMDLFEDEVPAAELVTRYPWLTVPIDAAATHVTVSQRTLREGAMVVVRGEVRVGGASGDPGSYRAPAAALALGAGHDGSLEVTRASRAWPVTRVLAVGAVVSVVSLALLASSGLAAETAWMLSSLR